MDNDKNLILQPIRENTVILISKIAFLMILLDVVYLLIRVFAFDLNQHWVPHRDITLFFLIFLSSLYVLQTAMVSLLVLRWSHKYFYFIDNTIIATNGILNRTERTYDLKNTKSVKLTQGFFGHLFHYGTIYVVITSPNMLEELYFINISQPKEVSEYIKNFLSH